MPADYRHRVKRFAYRNALTLTLLGLLAVVFYAILVWKSLR